MRILILGAGGTGGYFGGRLAQAGADISFLVRPARAARLREAGLQLISPLGDLHLHVPVLTTAELKDALGETRFDLVLVSCKAYDLDSAMDAIAPAVHMGADVLPLLNGLHHYDALDARFGHAHVPGGLCFISATLGPHGEIRHLGRPASITFGERAGQNENPRLRELERLCAAAGIDHDYSGDIAQAQWNKFSFLAALAAGTCLMRASVGQIVATHDGLAVMQALHEECLAVAAASGQPVPDKVRNVARTGLTLPGSEVKSSMLRDLEAGQRVEAAHIVGDMLARARAAGQAAPFLQTAYCHLQAYEAQHAG